MKNDPSQISEAIVCLELIARHAPLNATEARLIELIEQDIRVVFGLEESPNRGNPALKCGSVPDICIERIQLHTALNTNEARLIKALVNDIMIAFDLEGAVNRVSLQRTCSVPADWLWQ